MVSLRQGDALAPFFLQSFTGGQDQIISHELNKGHFNLRVRQMGHGSLRQTIIYAYNNKSSKNKG